MNYENDLMKMIFSMKEGSEVRTQQKQANVMLHRSKKATRFKDKVPQFYESRAKMHSKVWAIIVIRTKITKTKCGQ